MRPALLAIPALTLASLAGCDRAPATETVASVRARYIQQFREGVDLGDAGRVWADAYDTAEGVFRDLRFDGGEDRLVHADAAELVIDTEQNTVRLRLTGVLIADMESGGFVEKGVVLTDAMLLDVDVLD